MLEQKVKVTREAVAGIALEDLARTDNNPQDIQEGVQAIAAINEEKLNADKSPPSPAESRASEQEPQPVSVSSASHASRSSLKATSATPFERIRTPSADRNDEERSRSKRWRPKKSRTQRWCPTLRSDQATKEPVLCLNPGDQRSRDESPSPDTMLGEFEKVNILLDKGERSVNVWISAPDLSSLKECPDKSLV